VVDERRVLRLLAQVEADVASLARFSSHDLVGLIEDDVAVDAIKYRFIKAIEGCTKVAHHVAAAEGWPPAESNADAVRRLGTEGVVPAELAGSIADAVGFRNVLVHRYAEVDDRLALAHLARLDDLRGFASAVVRWLATQHGRAATRRPEPGAGSPR
jgi:uncharacterized protein YutE (UPF0331/DUF86 family)